MRETQGTAGVVIGAAVISYRDDVINGGISGDIHGFHVAIVYSAWLGLGIVS
jgi:hypothetical protein